MEHDERTSAAPGTSVTRSKNTVYTLPHDWAQLRGALAPAVERARKSVAGRTDDAAAGTAGPALLVVTTDGDAAVAVARMARELLAEEDRGVLPATTAARATRLLAIDTPFGVSGAPDTLAALLRTSALKLADVRAVVVAWADELLAAGAGPDLETIFAELPKDCARVLVAGEVTEEVEALIERYMRRPRRVGEASEDAAAPLAVPVSYLTVSANGRPEALRRLLDELDPPSAVVVAPSEAGTADARLALATLGYGVSGEAVRLTTGEIPEGASLVVLYELPDAALLRAVAASGPTQVVALVQPRQLAALRRLAGGNAAAYTLSDARRRADLREERLREEIRALLADGAPSRELLALEPLLADHDGVEIAAAVLRLLDEARRSRPAAPRAVAPAAAAYAAPSAEPEPSPWTRLFVNVGTRDGASAGDVLGAIAGESNISRDRIGRIEVRESHTLVDVATDVADQVVTAMTGAMMRGRRLVARVDQGRAEGGERGARPSRGERPARGERPQRGDRFDRGDRGGRFDRGDRGDRFERGERGPRAPYGERGARGDRFERGDRGDRGPRQERGGRPERGDRFDRGPRGGGGGERGGRPGGRPPFRSTGEERRASYGRTLSDEQREWTQRGERIRHSRRTRDDDRA